MASLCAAASVASAPRMGVREAGGWLGTAPPVPGISLRSRKIDKCLLVSHQPRFSFQVFVTLSSGLLLRMVPLQQCLISANLLGFLPKANF